MPRTFPVVTPFLRSSSAASRVARLAWLPLMVCLLLLVTASVGAAATVTLAEALDDTSLTFTSTGTGAWTGQTAISSDGIDAARSGTIKANEKTSLTTTISGVSKFSFRWRVVSEKGRDLLRFYIDDVEKGQLSGNRDWALLTYTIPAGSHTLRWEYSKDGFFDYGQDAAWVDQFTILEALSTNNPASPGRTLFGVGDTAVGQLGIFSENPQSSPLRMRSGVVKVSSGVSHTLFTETDGSLWGVGYNSFGQLGTNTTTNLAVPVKITTGVGSFAGGLGHTLFVKTDGSMWGMGLNTKGQLGLGGGGALLTQTPITTGVSTVAAGAYFSLFIKTDASLWAMGANESGQLGDGGTADSTTPVKIAENVAQVAASNHHTLFITTGGVLYATGLNSAGQLGDGTTTNRSAPVQIATGVTQVAVGAEHSLFLKTDGGLWAMGHNQYGQLGDGGSTNRSTPLRIATGVKKIAAGNAHTLFVKNDDSLWVTGINQYGQLGDGTTTNRNTPIRIATSVLAIAAGQSQSLYLKAAATHTVTFDLGLYGTRSGGGPLTQFVYDGSSAVAPLVTPAAGRVFKEWDASFNPVTASLTVHAVYQQTQTITFATPPAVTFAGSGGSVVLAATASSGLPVQFSVVSGPATLATDGKTLNYTDVGSVVIRATQQGNTAFAAAAAVEQTLVVKGTPQTITFAQPEPRTYGDDPFALAATTSAPGLVVSFTIVSGPATYDATTRKLTLTGAGSVVIQANQPGGAGDGARFSPATPVSRTLAVGKKALTVTVANASRAVGQDNPDFVVNYIGFVGSDTAVKPGVITTPPTVTSKAKRSSGPGAYPISISGGESPNYRFTADPAAATLTLIGYGGAYEAMLFAAEDTALALPLGKLELVVSTNSLGYTGTLHLAAEASSVPIKGNLSPTEDITAAEAAFTRAATTALPGLDLTLTVPANGRDITELTGELTRAEAPLATLAHVARLAPPPSPLGAGAHTLVLQPARRLDDLDTRPIPSGSGHATVSLAPTTAQLEFKGLLADGTRLTASLKPAADRSYRLWLAPYAKRAQSYVAGRFTLAPHPDTTRFPDRFHVPASDANPLIWQKAAQPTPAPKTLDATYPLGFGEAEVPFTLDPWLPPAAGKKASATKPAVPAVTLAQRLGLAVDNTTAGPLRLTYGPNSIDLGESLANLPATAELNVKNTFVATLPAGNPAKFKISITPATGAFTGSFVLRDQVAAPTTTNPDATKSVPRTVVFSGVLRQAPDLSAENNDPVGAGFFLLPALPTIPAASPSATPLSGEFLLLPPGE